MPRNPRPSSKSPSSPTAPSTTPSTLFASDGGNGVAASPVVPGSAEDGAIPASIAAQVGRAALDVPAVDAPKRRGRPPGSKTKREDAPQEAAAAGPAAPSPELLAGFAGTAFAGLGRFSSAIVSHVAESRGHDAIVQAKLRVECEAAWKLSDDERKQMGQAIHDYLVWANWQMTPGWALAACLGLPLIARGVATYALVPKPRSNGDRQRTEGEREVILPETNGRVA